MSKHALSSIVAASSIVSALLCVAPTASADPLPVAEDDSLPIAEDSSVITSAPLAGVVSKGRAYANSAAKSGFGVAFDASAKVYARDYAKACTALSTYAACTTPGQEATCAALHALYCNKAGQGFGADAAAGADVTLFGHTSSIFDIDAHAGLEGTVSNVSYGVSVLGLKVMGQSIKKVLTQGVATPDATIVSAEGTFYLGIFPVTVGAAAVGSLGIDVDLRTSAIKSILIATPHAELDGVFSAGIGFSWLGAGVEGTLSLLAVSTPATASLTRIDATTWSHQTKLDLALTALDGNVSLYGDLLWSHYTCEIFSWGGIDWSAPLGITRGKLLL